MFLFIYLKDLFFYQLVYDPTQKTLNADRGEIRVGGKYQADVPIHPLSNDGTEGIYKQGCPEVEKIGGGGHLLPPNRDTPIYKKNKIIDFNQAFFCFF